MNIIEIVLEIFASNKLIQVMNEMILIQKNELSQMIESSVRKVVSSLNERPVIIPQKENLSINEVSDLTGYTVNTIYSLVHRRKIPFHKPQHGGRKLLFKRSEIDNFIASKTPKSIDEIADEKEHNFNKRKK